MHSRIFPEKAARKEKAIVCCFKVGYSFPSLCLFISLCLKVQVPLTPARWVGPVWARVLAVQICPGSQPSTNPKPWQSPSVCLAGCWLHTGQRIHDSGLSVTPGHHSRCLCFSHEISGSSWLPFWLDFCSGGGKPKAPFRFDYSLWKQLGTVTEVWVVTFFSVQCVKLLGNNGISGRSLIKQCFPHDKLLWLFAKAGSAVICTCCFSPLCLQFFFLS